MLDVEVIGTPGVPGGPDEVEVGTLCEIAAHSRGVSDGHVAIEFVDASRISELNARYRDKPEPTDVLSFPIDFDAGGAQEPAQGGPLELGDVVICPQHTVDVREAIVHGMLHLLGMDHESDNGEMLELQARLLSEHAS
jgi:probable rRNA maturation factor